MNIVAKYLLGMFLLTGAVWAEALSLQESVNLIASDPDKAAKQLERFDDAASWAFRGYIVFAKNPDSEQAKYMLQQAKSRLKSPAYREHFAASEAPKDPEEFLRQMRFAVEDNVFAGGEPVSSPCFVFQRHPHIAYKALGAYWGSSLDRPGHCLESSAYFAGKKAFQSFQTWVEKHDSTSCENGTQCYAHARQADMYLIKAMMSPDIALEDTGLAMYTLADMKAKYPTWSGFAKLERLHKAASNELASDYMAQGMNTTLAHARASEVLAAYAGYKLSGGLKKG